MTFLCGKLGLYSNGGGVINTVVRVELGCERLRDRFDNLKIGYWRRMLVVDPTRLLYKVAIFRHQERVNRSVSPSPQNTAAPVRTELFPLFDPPPHHNHKGGTLDCIRTIESTLQRHSLSPYWLDPEAVICTPRDQWKDIHTGHPYEALKKTNDVERAAEMAAHPSTRLSGR